MVASAIKNIIGVSSNMYCEIVMNPTSVENK